MATEKPVLVDSFEASVDLSAAQFTFVSLNSEQQLAVPSLGALAIPLNDTPKAGQYGTVMLLGLAKVTAGASITAFEPVTTNAEGLAIPAVTGDAINGIALEAAADGDIFQIFVTPSGSLEGSGGPAVSTPTLVSGTAYQETTGKWSTFYVGVGLHAGGTVTVAIGPTSTPADVVINADDATTNVTKTVRVPPNWYIKVTVAGSATIASVTQITG